MTDIKIGLAIKDEMVRTPGQMGIAIAGEHTAGGIDVHIEAYGFDPDRSGGIAVVSMMRDIADALEKELKAQPTSPPIHAASHNPLDGECVEHIDGEATGGAARCPICRPVRPSFAPRPK